MEGFADQASLDRLRLVLSGSGPLGRSPDRLAELIGQLMAADACILRHLENEQLCLAGSWGVPEHQLAQQIPATHGMGHVMVAEKTTVVVPDVYQHPLTKGLFSQTALNNQKFVFRTFLGTPIITPAGRIWGVLGVYGREEPRAYSDGEIQLLQRIADRIGRKAEGSGTETD